MGFGFTLKLTNYKLKTLLNNKAILTKSEWLYHLILICSAISTMPRCLDPLTTAAF